MNKLLLGFLAAFALAFASCQQSSQPAQPGTPLPLTAPNVAQTDVVPINLAVYDTCCDEWVRISGNAHLVFQEQPNGTYKMHISTSQLVGIARNGDVFHGHLTENASEQSDGSGKLIVRFQMTSSSGCKFELKIHFHMTVDANGVEHAVIDSYTTSCLY